MSPGRYISLTYGNFTCHVHFQDKETWHFLHISSNVRISHFMYVQSQARTHEISCTFSAVSEISCVLHISKIKDIWHLLYISYTYPVVSEILHFMHIYKTRTHDISCTFPVISEISCVGYISIVKDMWHLLYISLVHNSNLQWNVTL